MDNKGVQVRCTSKVDETVGRVRWTSEVDELSGQVRSKS